MALMRAPRKMGVAAARPSASVLQAPWRAIVLAVGRFGEEGCMAQETSARQTHPTYVPEGAPRCSEMAADRD